MGKVTATGKYKPYDPDADDGTEAIAGVLEAELIMTQPISGSDADRFGPVIVKAPVKASSLLVEGNPLIGSADEVAARAGLNAKRFAIDDEFC